MQDRYAEELPLIDGAVDAVRRLQAVFRLGLASSSNRPLIELVLTATGMDALFEATVSSEGSGARQARSWRLPGSGAAAGRLSRSLWRSRTPRTACVPPTRPGCASSRPNRRYPPPADARARGSCGRLARRADGSGRGRRRGLIDTSDQHASVVAAEPHRVRKRDFDLSGPRLVRDVVEVALGIGMR